MKTRFFILLASVAVIAAGCKNYDDRFDDLNTQITALQGQVTALSGLQTEISALKTTISGIQSSLSTLDGKVNAVSSGVTTALEAAKAEINTAIEDSSTALDTKLSSTKSEIDTSIATLTTSLTETKEALETSLTETSTALTTSLTETKEALETSLTETSTALETSTQEKNDALAATLAELQTKLGELETTLAEITASNTASDEELAAVKQALTDQLNQVKEDLTIALKSSSFVGDILINSEGAWDFASEEHGSATRFNGDLTIHTADLSDETLDGLIGWVANATYISGKLEIRHKSDTSVDMADQKVVKFAALTAVGDLDDAQTHAHYPVLTTAGEITLEADTIETVKFPVLTTGTFTGDHINLGKATELDIHALATYADDLEITAGTGAVVNLLALQSVQASSSDRKILTLSEGGTVNLPELVSADEIVVENVRTLEAPKVVGADLTVGENVDTVNVGTADNPRGIEALDISGADDLETLKIRGTAKGSGTKTKVAIVESVTNAEIHNVEELTIDDAGNDFDIETLMTGGEIKDITIHNTDISGVLTLGHTSLDGGDFIVTDNRDITELHADMVNNLNILTITGNNDLTRISFAALDSDSGANSTATIGGDDKPNRLIADKIHIEDGSGANKQDGEIDDSSGLSGLADYLATVDKAAVYYDGAEVFKATKASTADDIAISADNKDHLVLLRKGQQSGGSAAGKAVRAWVFNTSPETPFTATSIDLTIGLASAVYKSFNLAPGGSPANHKAQIESEGRSFFTTNGVDLSVIVGGFPTGSLTFGANTGSTPIPDEGTDGSIAAADLPEGAYIGIEVGSGSNTYRHHVYITEAAEGDDNPEEASFSKTNKTAITHKIVKEGNSDTNPPGANITPQDLFDALLFKFPGKVSDADGPDGISDNDATAGSEDDDRPNDLAGDVPYGLTQRSSDLSAAGDPGRTTITAFTYDRGPISTAIPLKFVTNVDEHAKLVALGLVPQTADDAATNDEDELVFVVKQDIRNTANHITIKLTSGKAGDNESTIGQPQIVEFDDDNTESDANANPVSSDSGSWVVTGGAPTIDVAGATIETGSIELLGKSDDNESPYQSALPKFGKTVVAATGDSDVSRLAWL